MAVQKISKHVIPPFHKIHNRLTKPTILIHFIHVYATQFRVVLEQMDCPSENAASEELHIHLEGAMRGWARNDARNRPLIGHCVILGMVYGIGFTK